MFAALVPAVFIGAAAERGRVLPACIFFFFWSTCVYCPVVHWIWAPEVSAPPTSAELLTPVADQSELAHRDGRLSSVSSTMREEDPLRFARE